MGTGLIYEGQMPLDEWKGKYYFDKGVWKTKIVKETKLKKYIDVIEKDNI
jgi:hypothetical protein